MANLVESYARPGGTRTGMSYLAFDLVGKRVELLKEWVPQICHLGILARPQHPGDPKERRVSEEVAGKLGLQLSYFPYVAPSLPAREFGELEKVFRAVLDARCDALMIFPDSAMFEVNDRVARLAIDAKLPTVSSWSPFARNGLHVTYGPNVRELYRSLGRHRFRGDERQSCRSSVHQVERINLYSGLTATLRNLITPEPYCSVNGPSSNRPLRKSTVFWPLSITVICRPLAVISKVFHLPPAFGIGLTSAKLTTAPVP